MYEILNLSIEITPACCHKFFKNSCLTEKAMGDIIPAKSGGEGGNVMLFKMNQNIIIIIINAAPPRRNGA